MDPRLGCCCWRLSQFPAAITNPTRSGRVLEHLSLTGESMKICKLETFGNEFVCFVRVTTDTGDTGWGIDINPRWLELSAHQVSEV